MVRDEYVFAFMAVFAVFFAGALQAGYSIPGEGLADDARGHEPIEVPEPPEERHTVPNNDEFRKWVEFYIHLEVNDFRRTYALSPLEFDAGLREIARSHSLDMAENGYYDHYDAEGDGPSDRYDESGYRCNSGAAENINIVYYGKLVETNYGNGIRYTDAEEAATGIVYEWMNSSGHRRNVLDEDFDQEGIGIYYAGGENNSIYATQNFC